MFATCTGANFGASWITTRPPFARSMTSKSSAGIAFHAPADAFEVFPMLDGNALRAAVEKHKPDVLIPEIEAIDTATVAELEKEGWRVAPSANAVQLTMNRDGIRDLAADELGLVTSKYRFA